LVVAVNRVAVGAAASVGAETEISVVESEEVAHDLVGLKDAIAAAVTSTDEFFRERTAVELRAATIEASELTLRIPFATSVCTANTLREFNTRRSSEQVADSEVGEDVGERIEGEAHVVDDVGDETIDGHTFSVASDGSVDELLEGHHGALFRVEGDTHDVDVVELEDGGHDGIVVTDFRGRDKEEDATTSLGVSAIEHVDHSRADVVDDHRRLSVLVLLDGGNIVEEFVDITSEAATGLAGALVGSNITELHNTDTDTGTRGGVVTGFGTSEGSRSDVVADTFENTSDGRLLTAHGDDTVGATIDGEDDIDSVATVEALIEALSFQPETFSTRSGGARAGSSVVGASAAVAAAGIPVPRAGAIGIASTLSGVLTARTRTAAWGTDFVVPEASGSVGTLNLRDDDTARRLGLASRGAGNPFADRVVLARNLRVLRRVLAAVFTTFRVGFADTVGLIPKALPRGHAVTTVSVSITFVDIVVVGPDATSATIRGAISRSGVLGATIFTADTSLVLSSVPPAVENGVSKAGSFVGVENAASHETFRSKRETSVVVDEAARILTAIGHDGVSTHLFSANVGCVPSDPFAVGGNTGRFVHVDCALVVAASGGVGVPLALRVEDTRASIRAITSSAGLFIASVDTVGGVPRALLRRGFAGSLVAVGHASSRTADTGENRVVDVGVTVQGGVFDLAHLASDTLASESDIQVQAVEVHAATFVGARKRPFRVPFAIRH
jgi:hypothetical protein